MSTTMAPPVNMPLIGVGQPSSQLLGFMIPGGPVRTDFVASDPTGSKLTLSLSCPGDLPAPLTSVSDVVCFLLPGAPLPTQHGVLLYWQAAAATNVPTAETTGFELLGAVTPERPSGVFRTGWSQNEQILKLSQGLITVTLGVSIEPLQNVQNLSMQTMGSDDRLFVAEKIATDLFHFMQSFDTGTSGSSSLMTVPTNIFDRWMKRFENRFRRDPNFFLKSES